MASRCASRRGAAPKLRSRSAVQQLKPAITELVLAARQLEVGKKELLAVIGEKWEEGNV